jgi:hypothetical protein
VKRNIPYKGDALRFNICVLVVGDGVKQQLRLIIYNMQDWKAIREKAGAVNSTKAYITNDEISC